MTPRWQLSTSAAVATAVGLVVAGCASPTTGGRESSPTAVLSVPGQETPGEEVERPIKDAQLKPGTRYRFDDQLLPALAVDATGPEPPLYNASYPGVIALSPDADFRTDALYLTAAYALRVPLDPYLSLEDVAGDADLARSTREAPPDLLQVVAALPFVDVVDERTLSVGGVEGRALDVRIGDLAPEAARCGQGSGVGLAECAVLILPPGIAPLAQPGQKLRLIDLELDAGRIVVYQNLDVPQSQSVLDSLAFVERQDAPGTPPD
jgi:hypothetical protein